MHLAAEKIFPHAFDFKCIIITNVLALIVKASTMRKQFPVYSVIGAGRMVMRWRHRHAIVDSKNQINFSR